MGVLQADHCARDVHRGRHGERDHRRAGSYGDAGSSLYFTRYVSVRFAWMPFTNHAPPYLPALYHHLTPLR